MDLIGVMVGSALGGMARLWLAGRVGRIVGERFPWGTLAVNVSGAFALGMLAATATRYAWLADGFAWRLAATGFLGSYTTVSAFSLQCLLMLQGGERSRALLLVALSLAGCVGAGLLGLLAGAGTGGGG
ncbi:MAG: CrcB family protein [Alphaproteobacteria bacterium]|nr:CrcB family protein [Alphaproteobacteria bacterium]